MSKIDKLAEIAGRLSDDQIEGLIHHAQILLDHTHLEKVPPEVLEDLAVGIEQSRLGQTIDAKVVFAKLRNTIEASRN